MEAPNLDVIFKLFEHVQFGRIFFLIAGIGLLVYAVRLLYRATDKLSSRFPAKRLLFLQVATPLSFFMYVFGFAYLFFAVLKPPRELLLALGGGAAVAVGLSLKDLVASLFAGLILLFDRPFQVGDRVQFGDTYGEIKSIGLRAVRLQTLDDSLVTIPNSRFITDTVSSGNAGALDMMITMPFHFALDTNLELVRDILHEIVVTSRFVYMKKPVAIVASEVSLGNLVAIQLTAKAYVIDVRYEKVFQTEVVMRAAQIFKELGIERPSLNLAGLPERLKMNDGGDGNSQSRSEQP